jgi:hypothetical protein
MIDRLRLAGGTLALLAASFGGLSSATAQIPGYSGLFDPLQVLTLNLQMDPNDWTTIKNDQTYQLYRPAYFWADGEHKIPVEVRRKPTGADGDKISLKIDINEFFDGLQWHGVKKLSLENGNDSSPVHEGMAWQLHRMAAEGLPGYQTPLASWVNINVNGQRLGVYTNVEQPDKMFLRNNDLWVDSSTWLYKQGEIGPPELHVGSGASPTFATLNYKPFVAGGPAPPVGYEAQIASLIDMRQMLIVGAVNAFTGNQDELMTKGKNFFFADFTSDVGQRLYFPWDLDSVFNNQASSIYGTPKGGKLPEYQQYIVNNPAFKDQYSAIMLELLTGPMAVSEMQGVLLELETALTPSLMDDPYSNIGNTEAEIAGYFASLRQWVAGRHANIMQQLAAAGFTPTAVPEPSTWMLLLTALPAAMLARRRITSRRGASRHAPGVAR